MNPIINEKSEELSPENAALCKENNVEKVRQKFGYAFTPSSSTILSHVNVSMEDLILAEEYNHPVISKEEAVKNAKEKLELCLKALKESLIVEDKNRRGLWIATA